MSFFEKYIAPLAQPVLKVAVSTFVFLAGLGAGVSASSYKPQVNISEAQIFELVYLPDDYAIPSNAIPANSLPVGAIPSNTKNKDILYAIPSNAIPSNYIPSNLSDLELAIPSNGVGFDNIILKTAAIPSNALPASNIPIMIIDALPSSALPSSALPSSALPSSALPSNALQASGKFFIPSLEKEVCKSGRCGENTKLTYFSSQAGKELAGPVLVDIWADNYNLEKGECTNIHWTSLGAKQVLIGDNLVLANGDRQVCPNSSTSYGVSANGYDGSQVGSIISINVSSSDGQSQAGVELAGPDRCELFDAQNMKVTYLDWMPGAPLQFHIKIPGGVPGLEKEIVGDNNLWEYTVQIGNTRSSECDIIEGYTERLYCTISLPKEDENSMRSMSLSVNGCESLIYENKTAFLPGFVESSSGGEETAGSSGSSGSSGGSSGGSSSSSGGSGGAGVEVGGPSCGSTPSDQNHSAYQSWCSCMGGSYFYLACESVGCPKSTCSLP